MSLAPPGVHLRHADQEEHRHWGEVQNELGRNIPFRILEVIRFHWEGGLQLKKKRRRCLKLAMLSVGGLFKSYRKVLQIAFKLQQGM